MKIKFIGAAHEVTGSCTLLEACGRKLIIDFGMEQGRDIYENCDIPIAVSEIDAVIVTHAHIDHSGKLPMLVPGGFGGSIYMTEATGELCRIMLLDSAHIQEAEADWKNRKAVRSGGKKYIPPYTVEDVYTTLPHFVKCKYNQSRELFEGISIKFIDAGHLLGSSSVEITVTENGIAETVLFSGDIGNVSRPLIRDPQKPSKADYVIVESTYGNRLHSPSRDYIGQLTEIIQSTLDRGGNLIVPSFAVGRTQELLYLIAEIKRRALVKNHDDFPVWVDSPLAVEATGIYSGSMLDFYDDETLDLIKKGKNPLRFRGLNLSVTSDDSIRLNTDKSPKVIISASGMCEAGRIRHHLKHNLWRSECTVLFVGYQSEGTLGRQIADGAKTVKLFNEEVAVNARIAAIDGISGHADKNMLLGWLKNISPKPKCVYVNHGQDEVCDIFAESIRSELGIKAVAPYNGAEYVLQTGECLYIGNREKIRHKSDYEEKLSPVFAGLLDSLKRLTRIAEKYRHGANKDTERFTSDVENICDKWDY